MVPLVWQPRRIQERAFGVLWEIRRWNSDDPEAAFAPAIASTGSVLSGFAMMSYIVVKSYTLCNSGYSPNGFMHF